MGVDKSLLNDTCKRMNDEELRSYIVYKKYERKRLSSLISKMLVEKELKDKTDKISISRNMFTLDVLSLQIIKDLLKESGCDCLPN